MAIQPPTDRQTRLLWSSLCVLAVASVAWVFIKLFGLMGLVLHKCSFILIPLFAGAIFAYILDPVVDWLSEQKRMNRRIAIFVVFICAALVAIALLGWLVPRVAGELKNLIENVPSYIGALKERLMKWFATSPLAAQAQSLWTEDMSAKANTYAGTIFGSLAGFLMNSMGNVASLLGFLLGMSLVPVYSFYFLLEKDGIQGTWKDYIPVQNPAWKKEIVFVIEAINGYLVAFFRGQVIVAMIVGTLLTIGYWAIGIEYALLLGLIAGVLGIVPYLGAISSIIPAMIIAWLHYQSWKGPALVLVVYLIVQFLEGFVITPKIIGDKVGLHPLTVIIAVMVGTTLMGGILGGILALPLTAALKAIMGRYFYNKKQRSIPDPA